LYKTAICQINPKILDLNGNLSKHIQFIKRAVKSKANLIVFPEMSLSSYCYASLAEVATHGQNIPGPITKKLGDLCKDLDVYLVVGMIEKERIDGDYHYYNTSILMGPTGLMKKYRKTHIPYMAADRFVKKGDLPYQVTDTPVGKIGLGICYDIMFPEHSRTLALKGMEILINISNLSKGLDPKKANEHPAFLLHQVRAIEDRVFVIASNRVGKERGYEFIGRSKIFAPGGEVLAEASGDKEEIIFATIEPRIAREKDVISEPGEREMHIFKDRRPDLYQVNDKEM
jgi:predicted amidohydrolase